ncbi:MAG: PQQ-binding-like beta-propeller repeat protein [Pirellulaceae bacterium]|nr:PQQ-binding-like beta-propeller repeat protein [Pirellulaceae bacterium]
MGPRQPRNDLLRRCQDRSRGTIYCVDAKTGKSAYEERLDPRPGKIYASPLAADGKLYYVSRDAGVYVVAARPQFELLAHNKIESDTSVFNGSPAVADGRLLLRSDRALYCIGK